MVGKSKNVSSSWPKLFVCKLSLIYLLDRLLCELRREYGRELVAISGSQDFGVVCTGYSSIQNQNINSSYFVGDSICKCFGGREVGSV